MISPDRTNTDTAKYHGTDKLIIGIVLAVIPFWFFAQTTLNIAPAMSADVKISHDLNNLAVSVTALFSAIFIVIAGGLADRTGRVKITDIGMNHNFLLLNIKSYGNHSN